MRPIPSSVPTNIRCEPTQPHTKWIPRHLASGGKATEVQI